MRSLVHVIAAIQICVPVGCKNGPTAGSAGAQAAERTASPEAIAAPTTCPFAKPGFVTSIEDGHLWVLKEGQEKSEKHITLVRGGPARMTIKAVERETALAYLAAKPGFAVEIEDGRIWALRPGQEKSEKHISLVGAGPMGMTVKALDRETARLYVATKPGFAVEIEDGRLWVLRPGQEKSEKHITLVGAGPMGMTVKCLDRTTAMAYMATKPGFTVELDEEGRIWVFRLDEPQEKAEKHITRISAGPLGEPVTIKALAGETLDAYAAMQL
jgi:hypothetical protein